MRDYYGLGTTRSRGSHPVAEAVNAVRIIVESLGGSRCVRLCPCLRLCFRLSLYLRLGEHVLVSQQKGQGPAVLCGQRLGRILLA